MLAIRKVHEKDKFIEAAYRIVSRYGFEELTVKRLSTYLQISTQPIYLNFKGIQEVKDEVIKQMFKETIYSIRTNINKEDVIHSAVAQLMEYYLANPNIYQACWLDVNGNPTLTYQLFENIFVSRLLTNGGFDELTDEQKKLQYCRIIFVLFGMMQYLRFKEKCSEEEIEQLSASMLNDLLPEYNIL